MYHRLLFQFCISFAAKAGIDVGVCVEDKDKFDFVLYGNPAAPGSSTCEAVLKYCKVDYKLQVIDPENEEHRELVASVNPHKQIPTLLNKDWALSETTAIVKYIARISPNNRGICPKVNEEAMAKLDSAIAYDVEHFRQKCNSFYHGQVYERIELKMEK